MILSTREDRLKRLAENLKSRSVSSLKQEYPFYKRDWEKIKKINPEALSSQDFTFFVYLREASKIR